MKTHRLLVRTVAGSLSLWERARVRALARKPPEKFFSRREAEPHDQQEELNGVLR